MLNSHGVLQLGPKMPQQAVEVKYILNEGCSVVRGSPFSARMQVIAMCEDGRTVDIDVIPVDSEFEVSFKCPGVVGTIETGVNAPPSVNLPVREGASTTCRDENARAGAAGIVELKFCRP